MVLGFVIFSVSKPSMFGARLEHVYKVGAKIATVDVTATNGQVVIRRGKEGQIVVKSLIVADEREKLTQTSESVVAHRDGVSVRQVDTFGPTGRSDYHASYQPPFIKLTVTVPRHTTVKVETYNANIDEGGVAGDAWLKSYNGAVRYQAQDEGARLVNAVSRNGRVASDVSVSTQASSAIHLESYNGDITVTKTSAPVHLANGSFWEGDRFAQADWFIVDGLLTHVRPALAVRNIDLHGAFVVPAYGDAHTHHFEGSYMAGSMARKYLAEGTLYAQSMTEHISQKADANTVVNRPDSLDVAYADAGFTAPDGHPVYTYEALANQLPVGLTPEQRSDRLKGKRTQEGDAYFTVSSVADVHLKWPKFLASDPDLVKVFLVDTANRAKNLNGLMSTYGLDPALLPTIVKLAHDAGLKVYAHIDTTVDFVSALTSGVDGLAHMPGYGFSGGDASLDAINVADAGLAAGHYVQLTAGLSKGYSHGHLTEAQQLQRVNIRNLRRAGAIPIVGSDSYGATQKDEVEAWLELGQSPSQILTALCKDTPQSIFPNRAIGVIADGAEANIVMLAKDPSKFPKSLFDAEQVYKLGRLLYDRTAAKHGQ